LKPFCRLRFISNGGAKTPVKKQIIFGAPPPPQPLKPGQSAGIRAAQQTHTGLALIGSGAVIAVVLVAATASSNGGSSNGAVNPQFAPATTAP